MWPESEFDISVDPEDRGLTITPYAYDQAQAAFIRELHDSLLRITTRPVETDIYTAPTAE